MDIKCVLQSMKSHNPSSIGQEPKDDLVRYQQLCNKEKFSRTQFNDFIKLSLALNYNSSEDYDRYREELPTKHGIVDFDLLLNIQPQYLVEVGIRRIHQKLFSEAIKKRLLHLNSKKVGSMTRPNMGEQESKRWREAKDKSQQVIEKLPSINKQLNTNLIKCEEIVDTLLLALFSNEHVLLLGPPGTAKTTIAKRISGLIIDGDFFYNLMTRFTTPDEIFGPISLPSLKQGELNRNTNSYLPTATMALLDEIFKSSSIILNSILDILNERQFKNNGKVHKTPILSVIGTSNDEAIAHDLMALFDRFAFRFWTKRLDQDDLRKYLKIVSGLKTDNFVSKYRFSWDVVVIIKQSSKDIIIPDYVIEFIVDMKLNLGYDISERRLKKAIEILKVNSKLSQKSGASCLDCLLFKNILAGSEEEIKEFLTKFEKLYVRHITSVMSEGERVEEYRSEMHSKKWRMAEDPFRTSLYGKLKPV